MNRWILIITICAPVLASALPACLDFKKEAPRDGDLVQVFHYGGPGDDFATAVVPLDDGGFVIAGAHGGGKVFGPIDFDSLGDSDVEDAFVARMDRNGNPVWVVNISGYVPDSPTGEPQARIYFATVKDDSVVVGGNVGGQRIKVWNSLSDDFTEFDSTYDPEGDGSFFELCAMLLAFDLEDGEYLWHSSNGQYGHLFDGAVDGERVYVLGSYNFVPHYYLDVDVLGECHEDVLEADEVAGCDATYGHHTYVAAYDIGAGDLIWAVPLVGCSRGYDLALNDGSLALTGIFMDALGFVTNPGTPNPVPDSGNDFDLIEIESSGNYSADAGADQEEGEFEAFVAHLRTEDGAAVWARRIGGEFGDDYGLGVTFASDRVVVAGVLEDSADVCEDTACAIPGDNLVIGPEQRAMFVVGFTADEGGWSWSSQGEVELEPPYTRFKSFSVATVDGSGVVVGGGFMDTASFSSDGPGSVVLESHGEPGEYDPFVARFGADGALKWARSECGEDAEGAIRASALVSLAGEFNILAAGGFAGRAVFGAGEANETVLVSEPGTSKEQDIFVLQLRDE